MRKKLLVLILLTFFTSCREDQKIQEIRKTPQELILGIWYTESFSGYLFDKTHSDTIATYTFNPQLFFDFHEDLTLSIRDSTNPIESTTYKIDSSRLITQSQSNIRGNILQLDDRALVFESLREYRELDVDYREFKRFAFRRD